VIGSGLAEARIAAVLIGCSLDHCGRPCSTEGSICVLEAVRGAEIACFCDDTSPFPA
jgi:hypothetical protein